MPGVGIFVAVGGDVGKLELESPVVGGEIIDVNGKLGIQSCYGLNSKLGAWERAVILGRIVG